MGMIFESCIYDLVLLVVTLIISAQIFVKSRLRYFSDRNIPHMEPSIFDQLRPIIFPSKMGDFTKKMYKYANDKPYLGFIMMLSPGYMIKDPQLVQKIMIKDFSHFHDHGMELDDGTTAVAGHLFNMRGSKWRSLRYKLAPTFTSGKLKNMLHLMEESADRIVQDMKLGKFGFKDVLVKTLYREYSIKVIATCAFGIDGESVSDPNCRFRQVLDRVVNRRASDIFRMMFRLFFPFLADLLKVAVLPKEIDEFFIPLAKESFEIRKKSGIRRNDFIQLLLELKEKGSVHLDFKDLEEDEKHLLDGPQPLDQNDDQTSEKLEFTDRLLCAQMFIFWVAGYENASVTLAFASFLCSKNKPLQERVRKEVKEMKEKHGGFNYEALKNMKLLDACVAESLRLYPPVMSLMRKCNKDYTMEDGTIIEKGSSIFIPMISIHKDSKYWKDPEEYNPDRFLENEIVPGTYMPFGDGPRICIAQRFALLEAKMMLGKLIESFELIPNKKTKEPLVFNQMTMDVPGGLWVSLKRIDET